MRPSVVAVVMSNGVLHDGAKKARATSHRTSISGIRKLLLCDRAKDHHKIHSFSRERQSVKERIGAMSSASATKADQADQPKIEVDDAESGLSSVQEASTASTETPAKCTPRGVSANVVGNEKCDSGTPEQQSKVNDVTQTAQPADHPRLSKNQLKKKRRWEQAMIVKKRRKQQEREVRLAKAKAEGRDVEAERRDMEERRKQGDGWAKRNQAWQEKFESNKSSFEICLDCSFEDAMKFQEINSLASQIRYCYAVNKRAKHPTTVHVTSLGVGGPTYESLQKVSGFEQWVNRAFYHTEQSLLEAYGPEKKSKLCYLTSDSENVLSDLEDDTIYVIGGIVDRNRLKRAAIDRAESLGISHAKLPITEYLTMTTTKVLTCNHVFEILLKYPEHGNNWKSAFLDVLPTRKDISVIGKGKDDGGTHGRQNHAKVDCEEANS